MLVWFICAIWYQYVRQGNQKLFHLGFPYRNIDIASFLTTKQFEEALITDKKKLSLVEPLTVEDRKFLQSIFSPVFDQSTVDLSKFDTEKIQGYAIVLKQIDGKIFPLILSQYRMIFLMSSQGFSLVNDLILSKG